MVIMRVWGSFPLISTSESQMRGHTEVPCHSFFCLQTQMSPLEAAEAEFNADVNAIT